MKRTTLMAVGAAAMLAATAHGASAQDRIRAGILECRGGSSAGFVVGSVSELGCLFRPSVGHHQHYVASISRIGVDIGVTDRTVLAWAVFAPTREVGPGDLSGRYAGVSAGAALGLGGTANVLVGGSSNSIALQPLSLQGQTGLNVAVGVADLDLRYGR